MAEPNRQIKARPNMEKLGAAGQTIVINHYVKQGAQVEASVDQYDSQKDLLINGETVEIKTQVPFMTRDAFSFNVKQDKKCFTVKWLIFVSAPKTEDSHWSAGRVYRIDPRKMKTYEHTTKTGKKMTLIPIKQPDMEFLFECTPHEREKLEEYSVSNFKSNKEYFGNDYQKFKVIDNPENPAS